ARAGGPPRDFDATLQDTAARILAEIDRLDAIARAFSRFASPQAEQLPLEPVDLFAAAREVVQLYALGGTEAPTRFEMAGEAGTPALARRDEVKEVLVNLLENARNAGARRVTVRVSESGRRLAVEDDGRGIPADALPRVFEPAFSTTSSGAGLGLAIAKRMIGTWGGTTALAGPAGSSRATWAPQAHDPDPARAHPILPRPSALEHQERPGVQPRFRWVQSGRAPQHLPQSAAVPGGQEGADADQRRRLRHREGL